MEELTQEQLNRLKQKRKLAQNKKRAKRKAQKLVRRVNRRKKK